MNLFCIFSGECFMLDRDHTYPSGKFIVKISGNGWTMPQGVERNINERKNMTRTREISRDNHLLIRLSCLLWLRVFITGSRVGGTRQSEGGSTTQPSRKPCSWLESQTFLTIAETLSVTESKWSETLCKTHGILQNSRRSNFTSWTLKQEKHFEKHSLKDLKRTTVGNYPHGNNKCFLRMFILIILSTFGSILASEIIYMASTRGTQITANFKM